MMDVKIDEIGDQIYRVSMFMSHVRPPAGLTFNEFVILADEPLLFHCGHRKLFPAVSAAVARLLPLDRLRWISFGHLEADECGSMNEWLAVSPHAQIVHGFTGCRLSINDMADRPAHALSHGDVLDLGARRIHFIDTPHIPHGWDAGLIYEEDTGTLFCGDLFVQSGNGPSLTTTDILGPAIATDSAIGYMNLCPSTAPTIHSLSKLTPKTLAVMHGSSFTGDASTALVGLAHHYETRLHVELRAASPSH